MVTSFSNRVQIPIRGTRGMSRWRYTTDSKNISRNINQRLMVRSSTPFSILTISCVFGSASSRPFYVLSIRTFFITSWFSSRNSNLESSNRTGCETVACITLFHTSSASSSRCQHSSFSASSSSIAKSSTSPRVK